MIKAAATVLGTSIISTSTLTKGDISKPIIFNPLSTSPAGSPSTLLASSYHFNNSPSVNGFISSSSSSSSLTSSPFLFNLPPICYTISSSSSFPFFPTSLSESLENGRSKKLKLEIEEDIGLEGLLDYHQHHPLQSQADSNNPNHHINNPINHLNTPSLDLEQFIDLDHFSAPCNNNPNNLNQNLDNNINNNFELNFTDFVIEALQDDPAGDANKENIERNSNNNQEEQDQRNIQEELQYELAECLSSPYSAPSTPDSSSAAFYISDLSSSAYYSVSCYSRSTVQSPLDNQHQQQKKQQAKPKKESALPEKSKKRKHHQIADSAVSELLNQQKPVIADFSEEDFPNFSEEDLLEGEELDDGQKEEEEEEIEDDISGDHSGSKPNLGEDKSWTRPKRPRPGLSLTAEEIEMILNCYDHFFSKFNSKKKTCQEVGIALKIGNRKVFELVQERDNLIKQGAPKDCVPVARGDKKRGKPRDKIFEDSHINILRELLSKHYSQQPATDQARSFPKSSEIHSYLKKLPEKGTKLPNSNLISPGSIEANMKTLKGHLTRLRKEITSQFNSK